MHDEDGGKVVQYALWLQLETEYEDGHFCDDEPIMLESGTREEMEDLISRIEALCFTVNNGTIWSE